MAYLREICSLYERGTLMAEQVSLQARKQITPHPYIGVMALFQAKHLWVKQLADGVLVLVLDRDHSTANFLDPAMLDELDGALDAVIKTSDVRLLVIRSGKPSNFCHGPSPSLLASWQAEDFRVWCERGQAVCSKLTAMPIPSVCVIAGTCFDAGLELALACDHLVVVNRPSTSLGFPELEWGMIPCWGGTQRLSHLIGLENSLKMVLGGQRLDARRAWTFLLADDLAEEESEEPPVFFAHPFKRDWTIFPHGSWRQRWLESNRPGRWFLFRGAERILRTRIPDGMPAPAIMLEALRHVYQTPTIQAGLELERQALETIVADPALKNLLRLLLHRDHLRSPSIGAPEKSRIRQIGVIVDGLAGLSLYLHCIAAGYEVVFRAQSKEALAMGLMQVSQLLEVEVRHGTMTQRQAAKILGRFRGTYTWTHFDKLHMILDTSLGSLGEKLQFYKGMEQHIAAGALIVSISASHRVEDLQRGLQHPERLIGLHLIEPWIRGSLAEIVAPASVAQPNVQRVREWALALGKSCLQVPDRVGGLAMRIWLPALNEAGLMVKDGVPIDRIDRAMRRFGMSYGPLEWMDRLGIDSIASLCTAMQPLFAGRIALESGFSLMVEKQWLGNTVELGFYRQGSGRPKPFRSAAQLWRTSSQGEAEGIVPILSEADMHAWIEHRLVTLMILEAVRCLDDGLAKDADDLDCAMCLTGWATHRGGPIGYGRELGVETVTAFCTELARIYGPRYSPPAALNQFLAR
jgi:3-hydroxyacyl-CoA dehydrogenase/enoyl-CoA hydratase/3-hydroxybutyryl-CoA epimerase